MSTTEVVKSSKEYMNVPIAELIESSTNPRKVFDQSFLEELAESIRNKGILSPLLVRPVNNHSGNCCGRATLPCREAAGLEVAPVRLEALTDLGGPRGTAISKMCNARTCIPSRRRKAFARFLGSRGLITPLKNLLRESENARMTWPKG